MSASGQKIGVGVLLLVLLACSRTSQPAQTRTPPASESLPADVQRGMCVAHNYQGGGERGYGSSTSAQTLDELRELGVNWVSLTPFGFMRGLNDPNVRAIGDMRAGETDERVRAEIRAARSRGLHVLLKPHLWIARGAWRAEIAFEDPDDWSRWFDQYETWITNYARLAQQEGVEILAIGTELRSSVAQNPERWRAIVRAVRASFSGKLVYAANWDAVDDVPFWDALDYVGVQFYAPLADGPGRSEAQMQTRLARELDRLEAVANRANRPVLLTEVGYKSVENTEVRPFEWSERSSAPVNVEHQARAYRVLLAGVRERSWIEGIYWWKWFTDPDAREEGPRGFSPRGKPAAEVLRNAFR